VYKLYNKVKTKIKVN